MLIFVMLGQFLALWWIKHSKGGVSRAPSQRHMGFEFHQNQVPASEEFSGLFLNVLPSQLESWYIHWVDCTTYWVHVSLEWDHCDLMFLALAQLTNKTFTDAGKGRISQSLTALVIFGNILLWSILCSTVGLPMSIAKSKRTARRQFHSPALRCLHGRLCEVTTGRGPLKQTRWPRVIGPAIAKCGGGRKLGWFRLVFWTPNLRNVPLWRFILSDSYGKQGALNCSQSTQGLDALRNSSMLPAVQAVLVLWRVVARLLPDTQTIQLRPTERFVRKLYVCSCNLPLVVWIRTTSIESV